MCRRTGAPAAVVVSRPVRVIRTAPDSVSRTAEALRDRGTRVVGPDATSQPQLCWIHPGSTHGVLFELVSAEKPLAPP